MDYEHTVDIAAPPEKVWEVLTDVERWPDWTASVSKVERLDSGKLRVGSSARVKQPGLPSLVWLVTALVPGRSFSWAARSAGVTTVAGHRVDAAGGGGGLTVTLSVRQTGLLAPLVALLASGRTRRYVQMEASGLKRWCEGA